MHADTHIDMIDRMSMHYIQVTACATKLIFITLQFSTFTWNSKEK